MCDIANCCAPGGYVILPLRTPSGERRTPPWPHGILPGHTYETQLAGLKNVAASSAGNAASGSGGGNKAAPAKK